MYRLILNENLMKKNIEEWFTQSGRKVIDYQTEKIIESINSLNNQNLPVVMGACPSAGKTIMSIYIANYYINQGLKVLVLTHGTKVLKTNYSDSLISLNPKFTYQTYCAGEKIKDVNMLVTLPQSIKNQNLSNFDLVIVDEAHERYFEKEVQSIIKKVKAKKQLLLTGTPAPFIKNENKYPVHIISMQEVYQEGRINDIMIHICSSSYDIRSADYNEHEELSKKGNQKLNKKDTEVTLDNLLGELQKKLTNVFQGKFGSTIQNVFSWGLVIREMGKTMVAANSVKQAQYIHDYFNEKGIKTLLSTHENDVDSHQIELFKHDKQYEILVVVRRGVLGFDMIDMANIIDMTASRNLVVVYQLLCRLARKSDTIKMKHFIKMSVPNTEVIYELVMTAVLCLMSKDYISKYDGKNFGQFEIPVQSVSREKNENNEGGSQERRTSTEGDSQERRTSTIRPISFLGMPIVEFFEKVFHKDGKILNTHSISKISDVMRELNRLDDKFYLNDKFYYSNLEDFKKSITQSQISPKIIQRIPIREQCLLIEHALNALGNAQGKKRKFIGVENIEENFKPNTKLDRFHYASSILLDQVGLKYSSITIRKLMDVYYSPNEEMKETLLNQIDSGQMSISKAYDILYKKVKDATSNNKIPDLPFVPKRSYFEIVSHARKLIVELDNLRETNSTINIEDIYHIVCLILCLPFDKNRLDDLIYIHEEINFNHTELKKECFFEKLDNGTLTISSAASMVEKYIKDKSKEPLLSIS